MSEELDVKILQLQTLNEKLTSLFSKLQKSIKKSKTTSSSQTTNLLHEIQSKLKEYQLTYDSTSIELRQSTGINNKAELRQSLREHKELLKEYKAEYARYKQSDNKNELLGDYTGTETGVGNGNEHETADSLMNHGLDVQQKSKESLQRTVGMIHETKEIAVDTIGKLEANTEQIAGMSDKLDEIESTLQRSTKIIRRLARKMATDKYIWVFSLLVLGAIIALIVVQQMKGKSVSQAANSAACAVGSSRCTSSTGTSSTSASGLAYHRTQRILSMSNAASTSSSSYTYPYSYSDTSQHPSHLLQRIFT